MTEREHFFRRQKSAVLAIRLALISSGRLLLSIAIGLDLENDSMMHQPVNGSNRHHRVGKDAVPLAEGLIGRNQQAFAFISMSNQLKEDRGFSFRLLHVAQVVEDEQVKAVELFEPGL